MDERKLISLARAGDQASFRALYDANVDRVFRLAYRMSGDEEAARDFTQEAFVRAFTRLEQFRGDSAFSTWLYSIATSVTLNGLRRTRRTATREVRLSPALPARATDRSDQSDLRSKIRTAIDGLSEIYRTVFVMHDVEGFKHEEIAEALNVAVGTSKARLSRARSKLREALGDSVEEYV